MSDYAYGGRRSRMFVEAHTFETRTLESRTLESRVMFAACYALFLARAIVKRAMPWREPVAFGGSMQRETVFGEARNAASVIVASSFMGL